MASKASVVQVQVLKLPTVDLSQKGGCWASKPVILGLDTDSQRCRTMGFSRSRNWGKSLTENNLGWRRLVHLNYGGKWS